MILKAEEISPKERELLQLGEKSRFELDGYQWVTFKREASECSQGIVAEMQHLTIVKVQFGNAIENVVSECCEFAVVKPPAVVCKLGKIVSTEGLDWSSVEEKGLKAIEPVPLEGSEPLRPLQGQVS